MASSKMIRAGAGVVAVGAIGAAVALGLMRSKPAPDGEPAEGVATAPEADASRLADPNYMIPVTVGQPKKGAENALVTMVLWSDLVGTESKHVQKVLDALVAKHGDRLRLVYRHFTDPTSPEATRAHEFTRIAHEQGGKFWEAVALITQASSVPSDVDLEAFAKELGLEWTTVKQALDKHTFSRSVLGDRVFAAMFDAKSAPALFVNGRRYTGKVSARRLEAVLEEETQRGNQLVERGIPKEQVYAELIKGGAWIGPDGQMSSQQP